MHNNKPATPLDEFRRLLGEYGSIADLSRRSGLTRRAIEYKRSGERRVTWWDVYALERLLQIKKELVSGKGRHSEESSEAAGFFWL